MTWPVHRNSGPVITLVTIASIDGPAAQPGSCDQLQPGEEKKILAGMNGRMREGSCSRTRFFGFDEDCFAAALEHARKVMIAFRLLWMQSRYCLSWRLDFAYKTL
jgi:hypothetical protein